MALKGDDNEYVIYIKVCTKELHLEDRKGKGKKIGEEFLFSSVFISAFIKRMRLARSV